MNQQEIDQFLTQTLNDRKLTGSEKNALSEYFGDLKPDDQQIGFIRNRAFALARSTMADPDSPRILDWLEDVVKILAGKRWEAGSSRSHSDEPAKAYFAPDDDCVAAIREQFFNCRASCDICVFTVTDNRISDAILQAHRRGVKVRLVTDDDKSGDLGSDIDRLKQSGIDVRFDRSEYHMHHKYAIFDDKRLLTGSFNWTRGAAENNEENFIVTSEPALVEQFVKAFASIWTKWE